MAIGVVHGSLIWFGDILTIYALVACALVMFRTLSARRILASAILLWIFGEPLVRYLRYLAGFRYMNPGGPTDSFLGTGTWMQIHPVRVASYMNWLASWGLTSYVTILGAFLLGLWAMKSGYLRRVTEDARSARRLLVVATVAAVVGYLGNAYADILWPPLRAPAGLVQTFPYPYVQLAMLRRSVLHFYDLQVLGESLAYAAVILLLWQRRWGMALLRPLAATGRMALTTYLIQSAVCHAAVLRVRTGPLRPRRLHGNACPHVDPLRVPDGREHVVAEALPLRARRVALAEDDLRPNRVDGSALSVAEAQ